MGIHGEQREKGKVNRLENTCLFESVSDCQYLCFCLGLYTMSVVGLAEYYHVIKERHQNSPLRATIASGRCW